MIKKVILKGRVQGVGCRGYCAKYARKFHINGSASNQYDGSVKLLLNVNDEIVFKRFITSLITNTEGYMFWGSIDDISIDDYSGKTGGDYNF
ncbi:MAG TPA: acylphosphatase [Spirochaetota bacterium]|nr:acylphosphatase [Spirochaetota bacterium]HPS86814.1 acylphosphatase [Spirochaetota bacterium]